MALVPVAGLHNPMVARACPFCTPLEPTWRQWRERAAVTALAEVDGPVADGRTPLVLHRVFDGADRLGEAGQLAAELDLAARPGGLLLVFGLPGNESHPESFDWHAASVDEVGYAYFARAPAARAVAPERLKYYSQFLEHSNPAVAEDAYLEFAHAPFDEVVEAAAWLPIEQAGRWLVDPGVPAHRKGFYGLALGLAPEATARRDNAQLLRELILEPQDDFRSGFDGILGGYLLLEGAAGLELIEARYLANPAAADGDVRHALAALRFYHEFGREIPAARLNAAERQLLARPEFAETVITDLARRQDWDALEEIVPLYSNEAYAQAATKRAIVGFLLACPEPRAAVELARLRQLDPDGVAAAEEILSRTGSLPRSE